jgi:hypothetical protein
VARCNTPWLFPAAQGAHLTAEGSPICASIVAHACHSAQLDFPRLVRVPSSNQERASPSLPSSAAITAREQYRSVLLFCGARRHF